jgi:hypothetical protein
MPITFTNNLKKELRKMQKMLDLYTILVLYLVEMRNKKGNN